MRTQRIEDKQLYDSDSNPVAVELCLQLDVWMANARYTENGIIVNPEKCHSMVLGSTEHLLFFFTIKDLVDLLGMTII